MKELLKVRYARPPPTFLFLSLPFCLARLSTPLAGYSPFVLFLSFFIFLSPHPRPRAFPLPSRSAPRVSPRFGQQLKQSLSTDAHSPFGRIRPSGIPGGGSSMIDTAGSDTRLSFTLTLVCLPFFKFLFLFCFLIQSPLATSYRYRIVSHRQADSRTDTRLPGLGWCPRRAESRAVHAGETPDRGKSCTRTNIGAVTAIRRRRGSFQPPTDPSADTADPGYLYACV